MGVILCGYEDVLNSHYYYHFNFDSNQSIFKALTSFAKSSYISSAMF